VVVKVCWQDVLALGGATHLLKLQLHWWREFLADQAGSQLSQGHGLGDVIGLQDDGGNGPAAPACSNSLRYTFKSLGKDIWRWCERRGRQPVTSRSSILHNNQWW